MATPEGRESSQGAEGRVVEPGGRGKRVPTLGEEGRDSYLGGRERERVDHVMTCYALLSPGRINRICLYV